MTPKSEKPVEIIQLSAPNLKEVVCPDCKSQDLIRINSFPRKVKALGTKAVRKFVEFESIHLKCKSCATTFPLEREEIVPRLSATREVLETVLLLYFEFHNSANKVLQLMESLYSVELKRQTILKWGRIYGNEYCSKNQITFTESFEAVSGHLAMDGTFPKLGFELTEVSTPPGEEKKTQVPWLYLTALPNGTLCAIWEEVKTSKK
jgi:transposase-like protein